MNQILFNTEDVRATLDGRKTCTRRVVKEKGLKIIEIDRRCLSQYSVYTSVAKQNELVGSWIQKPYIPGDILYVQESWQQNYDGSYAYRAGHKFEKQGGWRPSIHMPKEAARLFLRVKDIRAERLQHITEEEALAEGIPNEWPMDPVYCPYCKGEGLVGAVHPVSLGYMEVECPYCETAIARFANLWDGTIPKDKLPVNGWAANPWVWVIEFERISKEEAQKGD